MLHIALQKIRDRVGQTGRIEDEDLAAARRFVYSDEVVSPDDIAGLFAIEQARADHNPGWSTFFAKRSSTSHSIRRRRRIISATRTPTS